MRQVDGRVGNGAGLRPSIGRVASAGCHPEPLDSTRYARDCARRVSSSGGRERTPFPQFAQQSPQNLQNTLQMRDK